jgi:hypothetical protein
VSVEPTLIQIELGSAEGLYPMLPAAQVDRATGAVGGAATPSATVKLTGAPVATDTPVDGLEPVTVPVGDREPGTPESTCGDRPT